MKNHVSLLATFLLPCLWAANPVSAEVSTASGASSSSQAEGGFKAGAGAPFEKGNMVAAASIYLGGVEGFYGSTSVPPLAVSLDYFINDKFTAGGLLAFSQSTYDFGGLSTDYKWTYTYYALLARGMYHFHSALPEIPFDPYVGLALGYNVVTVSGTNTGSASGSYALFGVTAGARYWFTSKLAGQLELGYGLGIISLGIAYRL